MVRGCVNVDLRMPTSYGSAKGWLLNRYSFFEIRFDLENLLSIVGQSRRSRYITCPCSLTRTVGVTSVLPSSLRTSPLHWCWLGTDQYDNRNGCNTGVPDASSIVGDSLHHMIASDQSFAVFFAPSKSSSIPLHNSRTIPGSLSFSIGNPVIFFAAALTLLVRSKGSRSME